MSIENRTALQILEEKAKAQRQAAADEMFHALQVVRAALSPMGYYGPEYALVTAALAKAAPLRYPYALGCYLPTKKLCRILHPALNEGRIEAPCVLVKTYRRPGEAYVRTPYDADGTLKPEYWSIARAQDIRLI
jgi:hypothetical protein